MENKTTLDGVVLFYENKKHMVRTVHHVFSCGVNIKRKSKEGNATIQSTYRRNSNMPDLIIKQKHGDYAVFLCAFRKEISYDPRASRSTSMT